MTKTLELVGHANHDNDVTFTPDESKLISAGMVNTIVIWDTESWSKESVLQSPPNSVNSVVVSSDADKKIRVWEV